MPTRRTFLTRAAATTAASALARVGTAQPATSTPAWLSAHVPTVERLIQAAVGTTAAWDRLAELCDTFGGRLTGSRNLELACEWAAETMRARRARERPPQKTMAPHWVRGDESLDDRRRPCPRRS